MMKKSKFNLEASRAGKTDSAAPTTTSSLFVDAFTLKLAKQDPWLENSLRLNEMRPSSCSPADRNQFSAEMEEEDEERASLLHHHRAALQSGTLKLLDLLIACRTLKLVASGNRAHHQHVKNRLELNFSFEQLDSSSNSSSCEGGANVGLNARANKALKTIACGLLLVLLVYSTLTMARGSFLLFQHDSLMNSMQPSLRNGAIVFDPSTGMQLGRMNASSTATTRGKLCAHREDIEYGPKFNMSRLIEISQELDRVGVPCRTQVGNHFFSNTLAATDAIIFYFLSVALIVWHAQEIRYDTLGFLYDPLGERRRLMQELGGFLRAKLQLSRESLMLIRRPKRVAPRGSQQAAGLFITSHCERRRRKEFLQLLANIEQCKLVRPIAVSSAWYQLVAALTRPSFFNNMLMTISIPIALALVQFSGDTRLRIQDRAAQAACMRWHPNGTLVKPSLYLGGVQAEGEEMGEELFLAREQQVAYGRHLLHPQVAAALIAMRLFLRELRHIWTWRAITYMLQQILLKTCAALFGSLSVCVYTLTSLDKITWLLQIRGQLLCCYRQVSEILIRHRGEDELANSQLGSSSSQQKQLSSEERRSLFTRMTVAYLNYELFKRQYSYYRAQSNFFFTISVSFSVALYAMLYTVIMNTETRASSNYLVSIMSAFLVLLNIFMIACSLGPKLISSILQHAMRLLALLANYPELAGSPALELWRRQLISEHEVSSFAATRVLAYQISYKRVVAFNVQLVATMLLIWQNLSTRAHGTKV